MAVDSRFGLSRNTVLEIVTPNLAHFQPSAVRCLAFPIWSCLSCYLVLWRHPRKGLPSITLTDPLVGVTTVISKSAAASRSRNPDIVRTRPLPPPNRASMFKSMATVASQGQKPSRSSLPVGMTHSISNTFPFFARAFRQFRSGMTA
jgi:hypothetical protein